jgi:hypothetical protein
MNDIVSWIRGDWNSHPVRMCAEILGMVLSLFVALLIAWTTPYPPMLWCYILWNTASLCLVSAAVSRGSLGLTLLYGGFLVVDTVGLWRTL